MKNNFFIRHILIAAVACGAALSWSCDIVNPAIESYMNLNLSREYVVYRSSSLVNNVFNDTLIPSQEIPGFAAIQNRISNVGTQAPAFEVLYFSGPNMFVDDTVSIMIGGPGLVGFQPLIASDFVPGRAVGDTFYFQNDSYRPIREYDLFMHAPQIIYLQTSLHLNGPVDSVCIRVNYYVAVNYLN